MNLSYSDNLREFQNGHNNMAFLIKYLPIIFENCCKLYFRVTYGDYVNILPYNCNSILNRFRFIVENGVPFRV